jgi:tetratricopeptide (TPR) repeat protein
MTIDSLKEEGNGALKGGELELAIRKYSEAIDLCSCDDQGNKSEGICFHPDEAAVCLSNRSLVLLKLKRNEDALKDASEAVEINPDYAKAHHRLGKALEAVGRLAEAKLPLRRAKALNTSAPVPETSKAKAAAAKKRKEKKGFLQTAGTGGSLYEDREGVTSSEDATSREAELLLRRLKNSVYEVSNGLSTAPILDGVFAKLVNPKSFRDLVYPGSYCSK